MRSLNEECGVFGIWGHPEASNVTYFGLHSLQHRGQEGAGIVSKEGTKLRGHRDLGLVSEVFRDKEKLERLVGESAIGHVRYATSGSNSIQNIQPFLPFGFIKNSRHNQKPPARNRRQFRSIQYFHHKLLDTLKNESEPNGLILIESRRILKFPSFF